LHKKTPGPYGIQVFSKLHFLLRIDYQSFQCYAFFVDIKLHIFVKNPTIFPWFFMHVYVHFRIIFYYRLVSVAGTPTLAVS